MDLRAARTQGALEERCRIIAWMASQTYVADGADAYQLGWADAIAHLTRELDEHRERAT